jgi:perosamine synthetase
MSGTSEKLALLGGPKAVTKSADDIFKWPIITQEDEDAVLAVLRSGRMSDTDITKEFEQEFAEYYGVDCALAHVNGTASLQAAMWACGVGAGDEIICPGMTYWASALPCYSLGATVVFAEIDPDTLCIDPNDIENRISGRTKAIVAVHYAGYPCDMDPIMAIAEKHNVKVIEDVSHAQGSLYKGKLTGTIGHAAAMSLMSGKSLVASEAGMLITNDKLIWERAVAFGHYARHGDCLTDPSLAPYKGVPLGGVKHRLNQLASALGRTQLRRYTERIGEIQKAMNHFWDLLEGAPGIRAHRPPKDSGSTMGGWYAAKGLYRSEELGGLPVAKFCEAVSAEGCPTHAGANISLHLHPVFNDCDIYGHGKPTRIAFANRDLRQPAGSLPNVERTGETAFSIPWFKKYDEECIQQHAAAYRKVAEQASELL